MVEYVKDVIALRKKFPEFRLDTRDLIENYTQVYADDKHVLVYNLFAIREDCGYIGIKVIINPNTERVFVPFDEMGHNYQLILNAEGKKKEKIQKKEALIEPLEVSCYLCLS
jgi:pullulanase/glycogen debranching enzyme